MEAPERPRTWLPTEAARRERHSRKMASPRRLLSKRGPAPTQNSMRELYPMHLISVPDFMDLRELQPHEAMLARNLLRKRVAAHEGRILFISHQWLGSRTPDPNGEHLRALQRVLHRLMRGEAGDVEADWVGKLVLQDKTRLTAAELVAALPTAFLWIDYISIPQGSPEDFGRSPSRRARQEDAVNSIHAYAEHATLVVVLVPPCRKLFEVATTASNVCDYQSWRSRGWVHEGRSNSATHHAAAAIKKPAHAASKPHRCATFSTSIRACGSAASSMLPRSSPSGMCPSCSSAEPNIHRSSCSRATR